MDDTGVVVEEYISPVSDPAEPSSTAPPSSPPNKRSIISSDAPDDGNDTPPSSPPAGLPPLVIKPWRPTFSSLRRKRVIGGDSPAPARQDVAPLGDITNSAQERRYVWKKPRLTQMQIDLGGEIGTACKTCGMEYIPWNAQDAALHKEFHAASVGGVDLSKAFLKRYAASTVWESCKDAGHREGSAEGYVMVVGRRSSKAEKNKAKRVLKVVNMELSAVDIEDGRLWSRIVLSNNGTSVEKCSDNTAPASDGMKKPRCDRFKVYLFVSGEKCVGVCLAERISESYEVKAQNSDNDSQEGDLAKSKSSSISIDSVSRPAMVGISRIWTSVSHRRKGVAAALLNAVRSNFIYGVQIPKDMMAFSQPTESGGLLAQKWFEGAQQWHVYVEK